MNKDITLDMRLEKARELRKQGYNCSQCVFMAFDDVHELPTEIAAAFSVGLGSGVGGQRQVCGTVSAMTMLLGRKYYEAPQNKATMYKRVQECSARFANSNGSIVCGELLADRPNRKPCMAYIEDSVGILHEYISRCSD